MLHLLYYILISLFSALACRGFTPNLVKWVEDFKAGPNGSKLELVFVSSDRDEKSFTEYHHSMNFLALPFDAEETKDTLSSKFKVQGIPTLVFVDASGELITKNGREIVTSDPKGESKHASLRTLLFYFFVCFLFVNF